MGNTAVKNGIGGRLRVSDAALASICCLLFACKGVGTGAIRFGVSVFVGVERSVLQSGELGNAIENPWGRRVVGRRLW